MQVIRGIQPDLLSASVVTLGMFDGVHRGHQALLTACRRQADRLALPAVVLTYEPHPSQVLHPDQPVKLLTPLDEKLPLLAECGMDYAVIPEFTHEFSELSAEDFLRDVLVAPLHPNAVVVGYRTTFGHNRAGTAQVLARFAGDHGFALQIVEPIDVVGEPVSSSRIRRSLADGDVVLAETLLGHAYQLHGTVARGDQRGHTLGIATANLDVPANKLIPADGIYIVQVTVEGEAFRGVMSVGPRPTFNRPSALEVHLLEFEGDLYGKTLTVNFLHFLREVRKFSQVEELVAQIDRDIAAARAWRD